jgi:hypothetical protein
VFENRVLRRIFGSKRDEVKGDLRKLHNEELHKLYSSPSTGCKEIYLTTFCGRYFIYIKSRAYLYNNFCVGGSLRLANYFKGSSKVRKLRKAGIDQSVNAV